MLVIPPPKYRRRPRLQTVSAPLSPPPPPPPFWQVSRTDANPTWAVWSMEGTLFDEGNIVQFHINGQPPEDIWELDESSFILVYADPVNAGDAWQYVPAVPPVNSDPPAPVTPQSGVVV